MSKKLKIIFLSTIALILVCLFCAYAVYYFKFLDLEVSKVSLISVNGDNNTFTIEIDGKGQEEFSCLVYNDLNKLYSKFHSKLLLLTIQCQIVN